MAITKQSWIVFALCLYATLNIGLVGQTIPPGTPFGHVTTPGSARTLVTSLTSARRDGNRLELLVIWRGSEGWYLKGAVRKSSAGGSGDKFTANLSWGGTELSVAVWGSPVRRAMISNVELDLGAFNVVLVDQVDSVDGPKIIKTIQIEAGVSDPKRVYEVISRSEEIVKFLQCDVKLESPSMQANVGVVCAAMGR